MIVTSGERWMRKRSAIRRLKDGMWTLRRSGIERIKEGQTTLEEIASATTDD